MKLATRITLTTGALATLALAATGALLLRDLDAALHDAQARELRAVAETLAASLGGERALPDARALAALRARAAPAVEVALLRLATDAPLPPGWRADDDARLDLVRRATMTGATAAAEVAPRGRALTACAVPLRDASGASYAVLEVEQDQAGIDAALAGARSRLLLALALLLGLLAAATFWITRRGLHLPLVKLIGGVDDVARGDLATVLLAEREDEIGALAARFNAMTASLREAREETRRGLRAQLQLEQRLRHAEKLATIGQLAAGIAHEVGTPLNVIGGRARAMARKADRPEEVAKNAGIIAEQASRITRIIQQLLDFARRREPARASVDVARVAQGALDFLGHQIAASAVTVERTIGRAHAPSPAAGGDDGGLAVPGDPDQVQQVILNLLVNAIQAMPRGGTISVDVSRVVRRKQGLDLAAPSPFVVLTVSDTGIGIAPEDRERIFEPFFSTKADGEGTGLGLAVSHGIVKDHDGWIEIGEPSGGGTTFRVFLPAESAAHAGESPRAAASSSRETAA